MTTKKELSQMASEMGRKGGRSLLKKRGKGFFSKMGKTSAKRRWGKKYDSKAT